MKKSQNFIIFFHEKEGTSAIIRILNNLRQISIVHQVNDKGWEPFDKHNCGAMTNKNLFKCINEIYSKASLNFSSLNKTYTTTANLPLEEFDTSSAIGFKMRFASPSSTHSKWILRSGKLRELYQRYKSKEFKTSMYKVLSDNEVIVFLAVRQDIFRKALSKYHGDGSGKRGHLQFKVASGELALESIPKIRIDFDRFSSFIEESKIELCNQRSLYEELTSKGIRVYPMLYEDFLENKSDFLEDIVSKLDFEESKKTVHNALDKGSEFKKVHPKNISEFVINHEEVEARYGHEYIKW